MSRYVLSPVLTVAAAVLMMATPEPANAQQPALQTGDLLLARTPRHIVPGYFKHVAVYDGAGFVIEAMPGPGGVRRTPLAQFWNAWPTIQVHRFARNSNVLGPRVAAYARTRVGQVYHILPRGGTSCVELARQATIFATGDWRIFWLLPDAIARDARFVCVARK